MKKQHNHFRLLTLFLIPLLLIVPTMSNAGWLSDSIGQALALILAMFYTPLLLLLAVTNQLLHWAINFAFIPDFVRVGWQASANIANAFFILVLLAIAIGTILRIQAYNFKKTLPRFVISVVLVNFSFFFCVFLFGLSNNIAKALAGPGNSIAAAVQDAIQLNAQSHLSGVTCSEGAACNDGMPQGVAQSLTQNGAIIIILIARLVVMITVIVILIIVLLVFSLLLILRLVVLWILISLAPLPYLFDILPSTQKYSKMWWDKFNQFLLIGPVFGLFLYFMQQMIVSFTPGDGTSTFDRMGVKERITNNFSSFIAAANGNGVNPLDALVISFMILIYGCVAVYMAAKLGGLGAALVNAGVQKGIGAIKGAAQKQALKASQVATRPIVEKTPLVGTNAQVQRAQDKAGDLDKKLAKARAAGDSDAVNKILQEKAEMELPDKKNLNLEQQAKVSKLEKQREASIAAYQKGAGVEDKGQRLEKQLEKLDADSVSRLQKDGSELKDATEGELARKYQGDQKDAAVSAAIMQGGDSLEKLMKTDPAFASDTANPETQRKFIEASLGKSSDAVKAAMFAQHAKRQKADSNFAPEIEARANAAALEYAKTNKLAADKVPDSVRVAARQSAAKSIRQDISKRSGRQNGSLSDRTFEEVQKWDSQGGALENSIEMTDKDLESATPSVRKRMKARTQAKANRKLNIDREILDARQELDRLARDPKATAAQSQAAREKIKRLEDEKKTL